MSSILYYSNYCDHCRNLLSILTKSNLLEKIHFLCIDKRIVKNSKTYIVTENNEEIGLINRRLKYSLQNVVKELIKRK